MEPLLTVKDLAEALSVSTKTVYRWTAAGIIPFVKVGSAKRYRLANVLAALEAPTAQKTEG